MAAVPPQLRLHEPGSLQLWPMSSSYPAPTGHLETRALLKTLAQRKKETEVVLGEKMEIKQNKNTDNKKDINTIFGYLCPNTFEKSANIEDIDDVDGQAEDLLKQRKI